jgi:hypothetical protein
MNETVGHGSFAILVEWFAQDMAAYRRWLASLPLRPWPGRVRPVGHADGKIAPCGQSVRVVADQGGPGVRCPAGQRRRISAR